MRLLGIHDLTPDTSLPYNCNDDAPQELTKTISDIVGSLKNVANNTSDLKEMALVNLSSLSNELGIENWSDQFVRAANVLRDRLATFEIDDLLNNNIQKRPDQTSKGLECDSPQKRQIKIVRYDPHKKLDHNDDVDVAKRPLVNPQRNRSRSDQQIESTTNDRVSMKDKKRNAEMSQTNRVGNRRSTSTSKFIVFVLCRDVYCLRFIPYFF
jgi:hypothetical protein